MGDVLFVHFAPEKRETKIFSERVNCIDEMEAMDVKKTFIKYGKVTVFDLPK